MRQDVAAPVIGTRDFRERYAVGLLLLFYLVAYLLPLGGRPLIRPDEFRYAEIPREMVESGDWTVPRLVGMRYFEKPALGYQLTALSFRLFGENAFALRLPSALAVGLTAIFLYGLVRTGSRDSWLPALSTGIYLTSGIVYGIGTFAVLDSQLTAALTFCLGGFYLAWRSRSASRKATWLLFAGAAAGAAFLLKGFLAFAVPVVVIVPFLLWQRQWKRIFIDPWLPLAGAAAVALPWSLAIARAEPDFWRYFVVMEHFNRFTGSTYDRDPQPFWYFIPVLLGGLMPAGLLVSAAWTGWTKRLLKNSFSRYLLCWTVIPFLFFSISSCKLATYILPCFPPLAVLIALGIRGGLRRRPELTGKILDLTLKIWGVLLIAVVVVAAVGLAVIRFHPQWIVLYAAGDLWPYFTLLFLALWGIGLIRSRRWRRERQLAFFLFGLAPALVCAFNAVPPALLGNKATGLAIRACLEELPLRPGDVVMADRSGLQAAAWLLKRTDLVLLGRPGEFHYALGQYPEEYAGRQCREDELGEYLRRLPGGCVAILLRSLERKPLPEEVEVLESVSRHGVTVVRLR